MNDYYMDEKDYMSGVTFNVCYNDKVKVKICRDVSFRKDYKHNSFWLSLFMIII